MIVATFPCPINMIIIIMMLQYARIGLLLTDGVALAVGVYNTLYPAKKPTPIKIYAEQPSLTVKVRRSRVVVVDESTCWRCGCIPCQPMTHGRAFIS